MSETREFDLGDVLSVTTGVLVSREHIGGVYKLLGFMIGKSLFTHELPSASDVCQPELLAQFPELADIEPPDFSAMPRDEVKDAVFAWVAEQRAVYGSSRMVAALETPQAAMTAAEQLEESLAILNRMAGDRPVIVVDTEDFDV